MSKISTDMGYDRGTLDSIFKCYSCGRPRLMCGCDNENCENYYGKIIKEEFDKAKRKGGDK